MMDCTQVRETLEALIDGEHKAGLDAALRHTAECAECAEWHAQMQLLARALDAPGSPVPEIHLSGRVMAQLPARHPLAADETNRRSSVSALKLLGWCYIVGAALVGMVACAVIFTSPSGVATGGIVAIIEGIRSAASLLGGLAAAARALLTVFVRSGLLTGLAGFLVVDSLLLVLVAMALRMRRGVAALVAV